MTQSDTLMQLQADVSGLPVRVSSTPNLSALGVAQLAGLQAGWWTWSELENRSGVASRPTVPPGIDAASSADLRSTWAGEVGRSRGLGIRTHDGERAAS